MRHQFRGVRTGAIGFVLAVGLQSGAVEASDFAAFDAATVVVRTYTEPRLESDIRTARRTATAILEREGIQIDWLECGKKKVSGAVLCSRALQANELVVRIVSVGTPADRPDVGTLGSAFIDVGGGGGSLATVFADRVLTLAQGAQVGVAGLLGKTLAHEIGHLLLGTNHHSAQGLMRASWSAADLRRAGAAQWQFDHEEGKAMRNGIANRLQYAASNNTHLRASSE
jgi:hypothetical protein